MNRFSLLVSSMFAASLCLLAATDVSAHRSDPGSVQGPQHIQKLRSGAHARKLMLAKRAMDLPPAARDALALERLYRRQGKVDSAVSMYQGLLDRSADPALRQIAHRRLARIAWRQGDAVSAEKHLRASLDEQLSRQ
ncbi:MAG: tetratricopeptide repeat protein [Ahniella sp.]|nr:tetratricopeptide repeat protein [Ahniella sp.]